MNEPIDEVTEHTDDVELGFLEPYNGTLWNIWDSGKIGGKPVFLNPEYIFEPSQVTCKVCNNTMMFLLQVYAPIDDMEDRA